MRFVLGAALLAFVFASGGFILAQGGPRPATAEPVVQPVAERSGEAGGARELLEKLMRVANRDEASAHAEGESPDDAQVYYQYVDATGSVHFVQGKDQVPPEYRERAGRVAIETPRIARAEPASRSNRRPFAHAGGPEVVIYTTPWCGWCRKTLAWLDQRGVAYVNKDIESDERHRDELIDKTGRTTIPVVEIGGELVRGYDPPRMQKLLGS